MDGRGSLMTGIGVSRLCCVSASTLISLRVRQMLTPPASVLSGGTVLFCEAFVNVSQMPHTPNMNHLRLTEEKALMLSKLAQLRTVKGCSHLVMYRSEQTAQ